MPRFFMFFYVFVSWTVLALAAWSIIADAVFSPVILTVGLISIVAAGSGWGGFHYRPRQVKDSFVVPADRVANLSELAARHNFFIGTIGYSTGLEVLGAALGQHFNSMT